MEPPTIRYAQTRDGVDIAYCVAGHGPTTSCASPASSNLEVLGRRPTRERCSDGSASFARVVMYDKRGQGLSDRPAQPPTLEQAMEDARAVLDAAAVDRAAVFAVSEGGPDCRPAGRHVSARVSQLALYGTWARLIQAPDYPEGLSLEAFEEFIATARQDWGGPVALALWAPEIADDPVVQRWWAKLLRTGTSPAGAEALIRLYTELDARHVLSTITAPTLVLHRTHDRMVPIGAARALAAAIPNARLVELPGNAHLPVVDPDQIVDEVEEFLTGQRAERAPDRMLATVMFTDIVDSTARAAALGDRDWRALVRRTTTSSAARSSATAAVR